MQKPPVITLIILTCLIALVGCGGQITTSTQDNSPVDSLLKNIAVSPQTFFKTTHQVSFYVPLVDSNHQALPNAYVVAYDQSQPELALFKGMSNENGVVSGSILLLTGPHTLVVDVDAPGYNKITTKISINSEQTSLNITSINFPSLKASAIVPLADLDGDGVPNQYDDYPTNPTLAFNINFPSYDLLYEDMYPQASSDWDVNDLVVKMVITAATNKATQVKKLFGSAELMARGADGAYVSDFHLNLTLPSALKGSATQSLLNPYGVTVNTLTTVFDNSILDLKLFTHTGTLFATTNASLIDTQMNKPYYKGSKAIFTITFDSASFKLQDKTFPPFDPYLMVQNPKLGKTFDIHLPFNDAIAGSQNPGDYPYAHFIDDNNFPYVMMLPTNFAWPLETVRVSTAYPDFIKWVSSAFSDFTTWYLTPDTSKVYTQHLH